MSARSIFPVLVLFLAAGCSGPKPQFYWYYPGKTLDEVKADYSECECKAQEEATKAVEDEYFDRLRSPAVLAGEEASAKKNKSADPALQARTDWGGLYEQNALAGCMQSRGYVKLRPDQISPDLRTKKLRMGAIAGN